MTEKKRIAMPFEAEWIIGKIREHGFEAFAVGGCVRDSLLGREPEDWDITTSAMPEEVKAIFPKTIDTGLKHGTVTILKNHKGYEVTTYRIDGEYHDGRHPDTVEFTRSLIEDLKRRDFTINAMAYSHETGIVDEFEGMKDLKAGVIRAVGCARDRFSEDALRILRALRFSAQLGFSIEPETLAAIGGIAPNLLKVSRERIQTELTKLLLSEHTDRLVLLSETGIAPYLSEGFPEALLAYRCGMMPESDGMNAVGALPEPVEVSPAGGLSAKPEKSAETSAETGLAARGEFFELAALQREKSLRWAGLLRFETPEQAGKLLRALKLDNETIANVKQMIGVFREPPQAEKPSLRRVLSRVSSGQFEGALQLIALAESERAGALRRLWDEILAAGDCISMKTLAVNGSDLIACGVRPGKELGDLLAELFALVLEEPEKNRREVLLEEVRKSLP